MPDILTEMLRKATKGFAKKSIPAESRTATIELLQKLFGTAEQEPAPLPKELQKLLFATGLPEDQPTVVSSKSAPGKYSGGPESYEEDPHAELAVLLAQRAYPHATGRVAKFDIGRKGLDEGILGTTQSSLWNFPVVTLAPQGDFDRARTTLLHELGHVIGLDDDWISNKFTSAYDVGLLADMLSKDIQLPAEKKK